MKRAELEQKIADISLIQQQLMDRIAQAQFMRGALLDQRNTINAEIHVLIRSLKIKTLQQARQHLRLRHNLELLRMIHTYLDELDAKLVFYQTGRDRLGYLRQLAQDDIRMITAINDLQIDALTTQISLVINRYLPEAHVIQIDPQQVTLISTEQVWDRVIGNR